MGSPDGVRLSTCWTKLIFVLNCPEGYWNDGSSPSGWIRYEEVEQYRYFSKCNVRHGPFEAATDKVLLWRKSGTGSLPLVFNLDRDLLREWGISASLTSDTRMELQGADLVPLCGGKVCLGLTFRGEETSLGDYLGFSSARVPGKIELSSAATEGGVVLAQLVRELEAALGARRTPALEDLDLGAKYSERAWVMQYLLSPTEVWRDCGLSGATDLMGPEHRAGNNLLRLVASFSPPGTTAPKNPEGVRLVAPHADAQEGLRLATHTYGVTAWADDSVQFSRDTRHHVFLESQYLHFLLAQFASSDDRAAISAQIDPEIRRRLFAAL
jgi:hypothetical protein